MKRVVAQFALLLGLCSSSYAQVIDDSLEPDRVDDQRAVLALVPDGSETVRAVADGNWSDPDVWSGAVPAAGARVLIGPERTIRYDVTSDDSIAALRVDGVLAFTDALPTRLTVNTVVVTSEGRLEIGTDAAPIRFDAPAEIVFQGTTERLADLGLGLLSFGAVSIHGEARTAFGRATTVPASGATSIELDVEPQGWRAGNRLLIPGTMPASQGGVDEVVTLTAIEGRVVHFEPALAESRTSPRADLTPHVANLDRAVVFRSASTDIPSRGHMQFMHRRDVQVRYALLSDLGRTDRMRDSGSNNPPQRYPAYFHSTGPGTVFEDPQQTVGCVVERSLGHGFVARDTHITWDFNIAYDIVGGGFVTEAGNETGALRWNLAVHLSGRDGSGGGHPKATAGTQNYAGGGVGFWFQSRVLYNLHNAAANLDGDGFVYFHRGTPLVRDVRRDTLDHPAATNYLDRNVGNGFDLDRPSIQGFLDNEAYGVDGFGLHVIKNTPTQHHDDRSVLLGFVGWNVQNGVFWDYTGHYLARDFAVYAHSESQRRDWSSNGVRLGQNIVDMTFHNFHVEGFVNGLHVHHNSAANKLRFNSVPNNLQASAMNFVGNLTDIELEAHDEAHLVVRTDEPAHTAAVVNLSAESNLVLGDEPAGQPTLILDGERVDSLGRDPFFFGSPQEIESTSIRNVFEMSVSGLVAEGTYAEADGTRVALYDLLVTDRLSGARRRYELPVRLLDEGLYRGAPDLGTIEVTRVAGVPTVNSSPYASLDHALTQRGAAIEIDVLANDTDVDGDSFEVVAFTTPRHGTLEALGEGRFRYTPDEGFDGLDAFSYQVEDSSGSGRASGGRVRIDVIATASDSLPRVPRPGVDAGMRTDGGVVDAPDGGSDAGPGGGPGGRPGEDPTASSGGCQVTAGPTPGFGVLLLAWLMARRRR